MMQALRDNMKIIIWITAIIFLVGFGILELGGVLDQSGAGGRSGVVGKVNGEPIRLEEFNRVYSQMAEELQRQRPLQEGEDSYIREQAWQQIVRAKLMDQEARKRGIEVTPEEIKAAIRLTPPDFLMQAPVFQTDGQFDYRKYLAELENPNSQLPWSQVEAAVATQLPTQKLQDAVVAGAKVSEGDVRDRFLLQNETVHIKFVAFHPDSFPIDTTRIGGADIESYYKAHPEQFTGPAEIKVQVLLVPRLPDESDFAAARERLQGLLDELKAQPDSFESYARTFSEIQSASRGGDPGGEPLLDEMRPAFRNGLRAVPEGQVSPILKEERSLHIFRVDRKYPDAQTGRERIKYHEIAVRVRPGTEAVRVAREQIDDLVKEAKGPGLASVATKRGLRTFETAYFAQGRSGNSLFEQFPEAETWLFQAKEGSISRPLPSETGWYLYQVLDRRDAGLRALEDVEREAKVALMRSLRVAKAEEATQRALAAIRGGMTPEAAASQFGGFSGEAPSITRNGVMGQLQRDPRAAGVLMTVPVGSWSPVLGGETGPVFAALIVSHAQPTEEQFREQAPAIRQNLMNERRQVAFIEWMQDVRRKAKIEDYREDYFEV
ncbi:MAG TPA: SurA N-terminal domain-containing protein [Candidatus Eisenbacteria bacterium]|nr:SurA N-terminal domain-containing protein [Candidatus Eisenbacteria bacterium]